MQYKRMCDEFIKLDVEKINGYLCAIESLNGADYPKVDYSFTHLKNTGSLLKSIEDYIAATYPNEVFIQAIPCLFACRHVENIQV